jgi:N-acetylglucosamine-6-phosphate deacetylase
VVEIDGSGRIGKISNEPHGVDLDFSGLLIVPGFVDLHIHGGGGSDFMDGTVEAARTVARTHAATGTTSMLATTLTASRADVDRAILAITAVMDDPYGNEAAIRGIHLEGPYICSKRRGAQPETPIRLPDIAELDSWQDLSGGRIKQITMAPEISGALDFIKHAASIGVNVSLGHTDGTAEDVAAAVTAGASQGTHLFNAMTAMTHRAPGVAGALLADDRVYCELICDGFHVDPLVVKISVRTKGSDKILLITDAMSGASMPDGNYELGGEKVIVSGGAAKLVDGTLAGSVLTMNNAFHNVVQFAGVSSVEASRMSSLNAAGRIGLSNEIGTIELGKQADFAVIDTSTGQVQATIRQGKVIYMRP